MDRGRPQSPAGTPGPAPTFGQDNADLLTALLGQPAEQVAHWAEDAVITTVPVDGEPSPALDPQELVARGQLAEWDPQYRQRLGI